MFALELVRDRNGMDNLHVAGCSDVKRTATHSGFNGERTARYEGATLVEALVAADTDMAAWFCCEPYTERSREDGCWTVLTVEQAPCVRKLIRAEKVGFEDVTFRPFSRKVEMVAPTSDLPTCRKCETNPVGKAGWTWCRSCVADHRAAKKAAR